MLLEVGVELVEVVMALQDGVSFGIQQEEVRNALDGEAVADDAFQVEDLVVADAQLADGFL